MIPGDQFVPTSEGHAKRQFHLFCQIRLSARKAPEEVRNMGLVTQAPNGWYLGASVYETR